MMQDTPDRAEKFINANALKFAYDLYGDPDAPVILLISGLGCQLNYWPTSFCDALVDAGFRVLRFDNRDVGLSSALQKFTPTITRLLMNRFLGTSLTVPYRLEDMVEDTVGLLNQLQIGRVHVVGCEMGGWIAQRIAIEYPERLLSLTNISSSLGFGRHIDKKWNILMRFFQWATASPRNLKKRMTQISKMLSGANNFNETNLQQIDVALSRHSDPVSLKRQLAACFASATQDISESLKQISVASLVIHGRKNPWVSEQDAKELATLIPGTTLAFLNDMGHYLSSPHLLSLADWIVLHAKTSEMRPASHSNKKKVTTKKETQTKKEAPTKKESKQIEIELTNETIAKKASVKPSDAVKSKAKKTKTITNKTNTLNKKPVESIKSESTPISKKKPAQKKVSLSSDKAKIKKPSSVVKKKIESSPPKVSKDEVAVKIVKTKTAAQKKTKVTKKTEKETS